MGVSENGGFSPQIIHLIGFSIISPSILGYHYFRKPPNHVDNIPSQKNWWNLWNMISTKTLESLWNRWFVVYFCCPFNNGTGYLPFSVEMLPFFDSNPPLLSERILFTFRFVYHISYIYTSLYDVIYTSYFQPTFRFNPPWVCCCRRSP